jgi:hypothetical protein
MSATPSPNPDRFDPLNQIELSKVIEAAFGEEGIDGFEGDAGQIYSTERIRPLVCAVTKEAIAGGWLGKTQWEISEKLTKIKDRAWLSRARYQGRISLPLFLRLWNHPDRPKTSTVTEDNLRPEMNRNAAIGIAHEIVRRLPSSWALAPEFLTELNYELGCTVLDPDTNWMQVRRLQSPAAAIEIVSRVCDANTALVIPPWYTATQQRHTLADIDRMQRDGAVALSRLEHLWTQWRGALIATSDLMESIWNREKRDAA